MVQDNQRCTWGWDGGEPGGGGQHHWQPENYGCGHGQWDRQAEQTDRRHQCQGKSGMCVFICLRLLSHLRIHLTLNYAEFDLWKWNNWKMSQTNQNNPGLFGNLAEWNRPQELWSNVIISGFSSMHMRTPIPEHGFMLFHWLTVGCSNVEGRQKTSTFANMYVNDAKRFMRKKISSLFKDTDFTLWGEMMNVNIT